MKTKKTNPQTVFIYYRRLHSQTAGSWSQRVYRDLKSTMDHLSYFGDQDWQSLGTTNNGLVNYRRHTSSAYEEIKEVIVRG